jgi:hypothetical protein
MSFRGPGTTPENIGPCLASITAGSRDPAQRLGQFRIFRRRCRLQQVVSNCWRQSCPALLPGGCGPRSAGGLNQNPAAAHGTHLPGESLQEIGRRESEAGCPRRRIGCQDQHPVIDGGMQAMSVEGWRKGAPDGCQQVGVPPDRCDQARNHVIGTKVPGGMLDRSCHSRW